MNRANVRAMVLAKLKQWRPETDLIFMPTPHSFGRLIGVVPFHMNDNVKFLRRDEQGNLVLNYEGALYDVRGYGPTDGAVKQRAILGPYPPTPVGDEII